jgi:hypothetical protein
MSPPNFPTLAGQGFVTRTPVAATIVAEHDSGREVRNSLYGGLYEFEVAFEGLASDGAMNPGLGAASLQAVMGLYLQCAGGLGTFLYTDPNDNSTVNQTIAVGDGATTQFPFKRAIGAALETVGFVTGVTSVTLGGVAQSSGWSLTAPNILSVATAPASGAVIAATFTYAFACRFLDDTQDFENFMQNLWAAKSVKFRSVRQ